MSTSIRVLILEDRAADAELMLNELRRAGFDPVWQSAERESDYVALLDPGLDIILADYSLPQLNALRALVLLQERGLEIPFIIVTGAVSEEAAVECMKQGATDYILKDHLARLGQAVIRAIEDKKNSVKRRHTEQALRESEERFRIAAQSVSDVVWQWDIESGRLDWYGDIDALLGYGLGQFPRTIEAWERILHPNDHGRVMAALEAHLKDDRPYREEYRILRKDGSIAHWRDIGTVLRDERGKACQMIGAIADITEHRKTVEQLRRSEAAFKKAQHVSHVGSWIWDIPANRLEWSDEIFRIFGVEKENCPCDLNEVIERAIHPDDRPAVERAKQSVIKDRTPLPLEYRIIRPGGTVRVVWAEAGELILDEAGQPQTLAGIVQDITERKKAEDALRESEEKYRGLVEQSLVGIGMSHGNRVIFANPALLDIYGYDELEEFKRIPLLDHAAPASRDIIAARMGKVARGEPVPADLEYEILRKDGNTRKLHCFSAHITLGGKVYTQTIFQDITERKRAEEALRESEEEYRQLFEMESDAIFLIDNQTGQILEANHTASMLYGYSREEFLSMRNIDFSAEPEETQRVTQGTPVIAANVVTIPLRWHRKKDNTVFPVEITGRFFTRQGRPVHIAAIRDITERQQAEEALKRSEERYRTLVENANDAIVVAQDGILKFANRKTSEMTGYSRQEIEGKPFGGFIHPDDRRMVSENYARRIRGEKVPEAYTFRIVGKSGKGTWVEIHAVLIQWQDRPATLNFLSDVTERKQAEDRIQSLMRDIEFVLGATKTALDIIDSKYNLRFVDPASSKARSDWPGRKCYDYFMGRRRPCPNCSMTQALRTKEMVVTEVSLLKEGQRPVQVISIPFQDEKGEWIVAEVRADIAERKRTEAALLASREELRSLTARLQSLREEERTTLAREIHDELGQALTALNMDLSWLSNKLPQGQAPLLKKVESMSAVVAATMQTVKRLSSELRPGLLDDLGLVTAMQWQAEEFGKRTWIKMKITFVPEEMTVERDLSTAIFRIFQELLTNIARHAKATRVAVSLKRKAGALELRVKDNGRGIKKSEVANPHSLGLIGVRERVRAFGGQVEIVGIPHKGTRVVVRLAERGKRDDKNPGG